MGKGWGDGIGMGVVSTLARVVVECGSKIGMGEEWKGAYGIKVEKGELEFWRDGCVE